MTTPPAAVAAQDITAALRLFYLYIPMSTSQQEDVSYLVRVPEATALYWGVARDPRRAAAWLTRSLPRPVKIRGVRSGKRSVCNQALVTVALSDQPRPADPGSSRFSAVGNPSSTRQDRGRRVCPRETPVT